MSRLTFDCKINIEQQRRRVRNDTGRTTDIQAITEISPDILRIKIDHSQTTDLFGNRKTQLDIAMRDILLLHGPHCFQHSRYTNFIITA